MNILFFFLVTGPIGIVLYCTHVMHCSNSCPKLKVHDNYSHTCVQWLLLLLVAPTNLGSDVYILRSGLHGKKIGEPARSFE